MVRNGSRMVKVFQHKYPFGWHFSEECLFWSYQKEVFANLQTVLIMTCDFTDMFASWVLQFYITCEGGLCCMFFAADRSDSCMTQMCVDLYRLYRIQTDGDGCLYNIYINCKHISNLKHLKSHDYLHNIASCIIFCCVHVQQYSTFAFGGYWGIVDSVQLWVSWIFVGPSEIALWSTFDKTKDEKSRQKWVISWCSHVFTLNHSIQVWLPLLCFLDSWPRRKRRVPLALAASLQSCLVN